MLRACVRAQALVETSREEGKRLDPGKGNLLGRRPLPFFLGRNLDTGHCLLMSEEKPEQSPHIPAQTSSDKQYHLLLLCGCVGVRVPLCSLPCRDSNPRCSHLVPLADNAGDASLDSRPASSTALDGSRPKAFMGDPSRCSPEEAIIKASIFNLGWISRPVAAKEAPIPDDAISDESALLSKSFTSYGGSHHSLALSTSFLM